MTADLPRATALVTVYNGDRYLNEALESLCGQSLSEMEIVVVNDGSTDASTTILDAWAARDPRVRVFHASRIGRVPALNRGLELARAPYVGILDADDVALPDRFRRQVEFLETHPEVLVVGGAVHVVSSEGSPICLSMSPLDDREIRGGLLRGSPFTHSAVMMRTEAVLAVGGYRKLFPPAEDYELWLRLAERGQMANLPEALAKYRVHASQLSHSQVRQQQLMTMIAQRAAHVRRETGQDLTAHAAHVDDELLTRLGIDGQEIERQVASAYILRAGSALLSNMPQVACDCLDEARRALEAAGVSGRARFDMHWAYAKVRLRQRQLGAAFASLLKATLSHPLEAVQHVTGLGRRAIDKTKLRQSTTQSYPR